MELIYHLGLIPGPEVTFQKTVYKTWALGVLGVLVYIALLGSVARRLAPLMSILTSGVWEAVEAYAVRVFWAVVAFLVRLHPMEIAVSGDKVSADSAILVCNHQSLSDYFFMVHLAQSVDSQWTPQVNFFTWYTMWRIPTFRVARNLVSCDENWDLSKSLAQALFQRVLASESPEWVVLFPEVNIRSPAVAYAQRVQGQKFYLPIYDNVLYPRFPGLSNTISAVRSASSSKFSNLYDVTVQYEKRPPSLLDLFAAVDPIKVNIHVRRLNFASVPGKRVKLEKWLESTWTDKDKLLTAMNKE